MTIKDLIPVLSPNNLYAVYEYEGSYTNLSFKSIIASKLSVNDLKRYEDRVVKRIEQQLLGNLHHIVIFVEKEVKDV